MAKHESVLKQEQKYREYRDDASMMALPEIKQLIGIDIRLSDITTEAIKQALLWRKSYVGPLASHKPGWDWSKELLKFRRRPRRLELAIWVDNSLCGLVIGRVSDRRVVASIHLIEGNPAANPLAKNILTIATVWLNAFATLLSCKQTSIERPIKDLVSHYIDLGYSDVTSRGNKTIRLKRFL